MLPGGAVSTSKQPLRDADRPPSNNGLQAVDEPSVAHTFAQQGDTVCAAAGVGRPTPRAAISAPATRAVETRAFTPDPSRTRSNLVKRPVGRRWHIESGLTREIA